VEITPSGIGGRYLDKGSDFKEGTPGMYGIVPNILVFINR
jgi:hypothetical protein